jgi:hypothetical protein
MPIEIQDCDGGIGNIIEGRGVVTDQELIDYLKRHLSDENRKFKKYQYILIDLSEVTKMNITNETVKSIAGIVADTSSVNPDTILAMVAYVSMEANMDLLNRISKMHELFNYQSCWESRLFRTKPLAVRWIKEKVRDNFGTDDLTFS